MYIHGYQIHNVLNVYRKQLSQPADTRNNNSGASTPADDHVRISPNGQSHSIFDKISTEIVDRITQQDATPSFKAIVNEKLSLNRPSGELEPNDHQSDFSYNVIDEHNRKITNTLPLQRLNPEVQLPAGLKDIGDGSNSKAEKE